MPRYENFQLSAVLPHLSTPELFAFRLTSQFAKELCLSEQVWNRAAVNFTKYPTLNEQYVKLFQREAWYDIGATDRYKQIISKRKKSRKVQEQRFVDFWDNVYKLRNHTKAILNQYHYGDKQILVLKSNESFDMESVMFHLYYDFMTERLSDWTSVIWIKSNKTIRRAEQPEIIWYDEDTEQQIWPLEINGSGVFMVTGPYEKVRLQFEVIGEISEYHGEFIKQHIVTGCLTFKNLSDLYDEYFAEAIEYYTNTELMEDIDEDTVVLGYVLFFIERMNGEEIFEVSA